MDPKEIVTRHGSDWTDEEIEAVFDWFVRIHLDKLVNFAFGYTKNFHLAQDVVQQKLMDAFRYIHTYDPKRYRGTSCPFTNWVYTMVAREAKKQIKQEMRRQIEVPHPHLAESNWEKEWDSLKPHIDKFPKKYRDVMIKRYEEKLTIEEIASEEGRSRGAIRVRLHRARQMLRKLVEKEE